MKKLLFILLLCCTTVAGNAQNISTKHLLGKWHMQAIIVDDTIGIDVTNIKKLYQRHLNRAASFKGDITQKDSLRILEMCKEQVEKLQMIYMDFHEDFFVSNEYIGGYTADNQMTDTIEYRLNTHKSTIVTSENGNNNEFFISIEDDYLILIPADTNRGLKKLVLKKNIE